MLILTDKDVYTLDGLPKENPDGTTSYPIRVYPNGRAATAKVKVPGLPADLAVGNPIRFEGSEQGVYTGDIKMRDKEGSYPGLVLTFKASKVLKAAG
jgi:hypothetical protein